MPVYRSEAEKACPGCGEERRRFGEEVRERLDYKPASFFIAEHVAFKYVCTKCEGCLSTAPLSAEAVAS